MDELDINPPGGSKFKPQEWKTRKELLEQFESSRKKGRGFLQKNYRRSAVEHHLAHVVRGQVDDGADAV